MPPRLEKTVGMEKVEVWAFNPYFLSVIYNIIRYELQLYSNISNDGIETSDAAIHHQ